MKNLYVLMALAVSFHASAQQKKAGEGAQEAGPRAQWEVNRQKDPATGRIPPAMRMRELMYASTLPGDGQPWVGLKVGAAWDFRGPNNVGGRTRAMAIDVTNENILLAGGVSGGMWRSTDAGATWTRTSALNVHPGVNAIAQDRRPGHTDTWYYLSGEAYGTSASGGKAFYLGNGMYKSIDGGLSWTSLPSTVSGTPHSFDNVWDVTWNVVTDASDTVNDKVYACMYSTLYRSLNGGQHLAAVTWRHLQPAVLVFYRRGGKPHRGGLYHLQQ